ncbi:kinase-like domain-containing protein [Mycena olivaceomarginata]|nr:kinase-like domain-containing protein [Mycena olivaceomarginata]
MSHTEKSVLDSVRALCAPFVESVYWSFGEEGQVYLVSESRPDANLATLVKNSGPVASADVLYYACEVVDALSSLHAANIIHRDLTPFNVFVDHTGHIVLSNFSNAMMISADAPSQSAAMEYQAPEHLLGWAHDFAVDCWSFGTLLHFLLAGTNPVVDGEDPNATRSRILNGNIVLNDLLPTEAKDLIRKCLERNPALRLTIGGIKEHNYFANVYGATFSRRATDQWSHFCIHIGTGTMCDIKILVSSLSAPPLQTGTYADEAPPALSRISSPKLRPTSQDFPLPPVPRISLSLDPSLDISFTLHTVSKAVPSQPRLERLPGRETINNDLPRPLFRSSHFDGRSA